MPRYNRSSTKRLTVLAFVSLVGFVFLVWPDRNHGPPSPVSSNYHPSESDIWQRMDVDQFTAHHIVDYLQWTNSSSCRLSSGFGGAVMLLSLDGQKSVCLDPEVRPYPKECLVYSFGVNNEWSFEDQMESYGCDVFAFDPSMNITSVDRGAKIRFFGYGIGERDSTGNNGWQFKRLSEFYNMFKTIHGPNKIIDYLKIDIEKDEWKVLPEIVQSGMMDKVRQLAVEVHLPIYGTIEEIRWKIGILKSLEEYGMVRFDSKLNPLSEIWMESLQMTTYMAYEIAWYNNRLRRQSFVSI